MINQDIKENLKTKAKAGYRQANNYSFGALEILINAVKRFGEVQAAQSAAAIAYYAIFSIFPLLLFLLAVASSILKSPEVQNYILDLVHPVVG